MKKDGRRLAHDALEEMRMQAAQRMDEGEHPRLVAASMGMHRSWAYKCRALSQGQGLQSLRSTRASGRPRRLTAAQERQVFEWINGQRPDQHGIDAGLWTRQIVQSLLRSRLGVPLSLASVGSLLARLGLGVRHPLARLDEHDPVAARRWREEVHPVLLAQARRDKAELLFLEAFTPSPAGGGAAGAGEKGRGPQALACVANAKGAFWLVDVDAGAAGADEPFVALLKRFMQDRGKPVHLVLAALPARQSAEVRQYVRSTQGALTLHFLPDAGAD